MEPSRLSVPVLSLSRNLKQSFALARELGVSGVEIDGRRGIHAEEVSQTGLRQIRKWLDDEGLTVSAISFPTRRGYADVERIEARISATKSALDMANSLGARVVITHLGNIAVPQKDEPVDMRWSTLIEVLTDIGAYGLRVGATLCAEVGRASPTEVLQLIEVLPEGSIQVDIVTGALLVFQHDPVHAIEQLSTHVGFVHMTDAVAGAYAGRGNPAPLGTGDLDLLRVLGSLEECGYHGWLGLEHAHASDAMSDVIAAATLLRSL